MNDDTVFDSSAFELLKASVGGDASFLSSLIADYLDDTRHHLQAMQQALEERNAALLGRTAHSLKSTSQTMGAVRLAALSRDIEALARENRLDEAAPRVSTAAREFATVRAVLRDQQAALETSS